MSIFNWLFDLDGKRKAIRDKRDRESGFGWAMTEFFYNNMSLLEIKSYTVDKHDQFDRGAQNAVDIIEDIIKLK